MNDDTPIPIDPDVRLDTQGREAGGSSTLVVSPLRGDSFKWRRVHAALPDMIHAGMASFCDFFLSGDEGLVLKAAAAYEYLGVWPRIVLLRNDRRERRR